MSDERGGRYFREARFFLEGEKTVAQSHILEARTLMGYLRDMRALGGPELMVKYSALSDGTTIKAVMQNGQYQAYIYTPSYGESETVCAPYLESGALTVGYITPGDLSLVDSSVLHDVSVALPEALNGLSTINTAETTIYALPEPVIVLPEPPESECTFDALDGGPGTFVDTGCMQCKQYPTQCELCAKKNRADYFNPSRFTGKMRLFMQALLGSEPNRIQSQYADANKRIPSIKTSFVLDAGGRVISFTTLLIRDENWNYWLVDMLSTYASMTMLSFSECADDILAELKNTPVLDKVRETQLEAMLFTYASASGKPEDNITVPHTFTPGAPITHGWHGAYRIPEAVRVAHTVVSTTLGTGNKYVYKAFLQRATFVTTAFDPVENGGPLPPSITIATEEEVEWLGKKNLDWMYTPNYIGGVNSGATFGDEFTGLVSSDAPVYAFYKTDDTTTLVRYVNYSNTDVAYSYVSVISCGAAPGYVYSDGSHKAGNRGFYITGASSTVKEAQTVHAFDHQDTTWTYSHTQWVNYGTQTVGVFIPNRSHGGICGAAYPAVATDIKVLWGVTYYTVTTSGSSNRLHYNKVYTREMATNSSISVHSFMLIPLNSPDAAYVGTSALSDKTKDDWTAVPAGTNVRVAYDTYTGQANDTYITVYNLTGASLTISYTKRQTMTTEWNVNFAHQTGMQSLASGSSTVSRQSATVTSTPTPSLPAWGAGDLDTPAGLVPWEDFLGLNGPGTDLYGLYVEQSVNGLMRYQPDHLSAHVTNGDFPNTAYVFLGWA